VPDPKRVDQPRHSPIGSLTQNGLFYDAAIEARAGSRPPELVRVYEKIRQGIWSYNGVFHLIDAWQQVSNGRKVFKFKLVAIEGEEDLDRPVRRDALRTFGYLIISPDGIGVRNSFMVLIKIHPVSPSCIYLTII